MDALTVFRACKSLCWSRSVKDVEVKKLRTVPSTKEVLISFWVWGKAEVKLLFDVYKEVENGRLRKK